MLLLGAWQGERISLRAVTQHPPSALETELAASILMAASTLRIITELMFSPNRQPVRHSCAREVQVEGVHKSGGHARPLKRRMR